MNKTSKWTKKILFNFFLLIFYWRIYGFLNRTNLYIDMVIVSSILSYGKMQSIYSKWIILNVFVAQSDHLLAFLAIDWLTNVNEWASEWNARDGRFIFSSLLVNSFELFRNCFSRLDEFILLLVAVVVCSWSEGGKRGGQEVGGRRTRWNVIYLLCFWINNETSLIKLISALKLKICGRKSYHLKSSFFFCPAETHSAFMVIVDHIIQQFQMIARAFFVDCTQKIINR